MVTDLKYGIILIREINKLKFNQQYMEEKLNNLLVHSGKVHAVAPEGVRQDFNCVSAIRFKITCR